MRITGEETASKITGKAKGGESGSQGSAESGDGGSATVIVDEFTTDRSVKFGLEAIAGAGKKAGDASVTMSLAIRSHGFRKR